MWEEHLKDIENGKLTNIYFMSAIKTNVKEMVRDLEIVENASVLFNPEASVVGKCPRCNGDVVESKKTFSCSSKDCGFSIWKKSNLFESMQKTLTASIVTDLLTKGYSELSNCHSKKSNKLYHCRISLDI